MRQIFNCIKFHYFQRTKISDFSEIWRVLTPQSKDVTVKLPKNYILTIFLHFSGMRKISEEQPLKSQEFVPVSAALISHEVLSIYSHYYRQIWAQVRPRFSRIPFLFGTQKTEKNPGQNYWWVCNKMKPSSSWISCLFGTQKSHKKPWSKITYECVTKWGQVSAEIIVFLAPNVSENDRQNHKWV